MRSALAIFGLIVSSVLPIDGSVPLRLTVTPTQSFAPATMRILARIEPSTENRMLAIVADGHDFYRSSEVQLDGDQAPKTVELRFSNLPGGDYDIFAVLTDASGRQRAKVSQQATVVPTVGDR